MSDLVYSVLSNSSLDVKEISPTKVLSVGGKNLDPMLIEELDNRCLQYAGNLLSSELKSCGDPITLECQECHYLCERKRRCNNRLCEECSVINGFKAKNKYSPYLSGMINPKFLTLTLINVDVVSREYFTKVRNYWLAFKKRLKRDNYHFFKGLYVFEVTEKGRGFHVHLHIIYEGDNIPQQYLSTKWNEVTKGSKIVFIKELTDTDKSLSYMLKYVCKIPSFTSINAKVDYYEATQNIRLIQTFGEERQIVVLEKNLLVCPMCDSVTWRFCIQAENKDFSTDPIIVEYQSSKQVLLKKVLGVINQWTETTLRSVYGDDLIDSFLFDGTLFRSTNDFLEVTF